MSSTPSTRALGGAGGVCVWVCGFVCVHAQGKMLTEPLICSQVALEDRDGFLHHRLLPGILACLPMDTSFTGTMFSRHLKINNQDCAGQEQLERIAGVRPPVHVERWGLSCPNKSDLRRDNCCTPRLNEWE